MLRNILIASRRFALEKQTPRPSVRASPPDNFAAAFRLNSMHLSGRQPSIPEKASMSPMPLPIVESTRSGCCGGGPHRNDQVEPDRVAEAIRGNQIARRMPRMSYMELTPDRSSQSPLFILP